MVHDLRQQKIILVSRLKNGIRHCNIKLNASSQALKFLTRVWNIIKNSQSSKKNDFSELLDKENDEYEALLKESRENIEAINLLNKDKLIMTKEISKIQKKMEKIRVLKVEVRNRIHFKIMRMSENSKSSNNILRNPYISQTTKREIMTHRVSRKEEAPNKRSRKKTDLY